MHEIIFGKGDGNVIKLKRDRGKIIKEIAHLDGQIKLKGAKGKEENKSTEKLKKKLESKRSVKKKIEAKIEKLLAKTSINYPVNAYVTFETNQGLLHAIDNYPQQRLAYCCQFCCKGRKALLHGKYRFWMNIAPEAENIWWENLAVSSTNRCFRVTVSALVTLVLLFASIGGISVVKGYNAKLVSKYYCINVLP